VNIREYFTVLIFVGLIWAYSTYESIYSWTSVSEAGKIAYYCNRFCSNAIAQNAKKNRIFKQKYKYDFFKFMDF